MTWIKRNLFFLLGSFVALALMGLAGWYLDAQWERNNQIWAEFEAQYNNLIALSKERPHPGAGPVDNIKTATNQQAQLVSWLSKACNDHFVPIPRIPQGARISDQQFSSNLLQTITQMHRAASTASVTLSQPDYDFTFGVQRKALSFAPGSLHPLAVQLGEVKAICDVLFKARINSLDNLRRERVSADDFKGAATDYLDIGSVTNVLATASGKGSVIVMTPYEVTFRCFSSELASVMAGFANSPNVLIVKTIDVEPVPTAPPPSADAGGRRPGGRRRPGSAPRPRPGASGGLATVLDERQLQVTLMLNVVKLQ